MDAAPGQRRPGHSRPGPAADTRERLVPAAVLADLAWPDLTDRRPLVLLPLGSCEQHGPHLPLHTDTEVASAVAGRAAARLGEEMDLVVAPEQSYGASGEHEGFPGTVSIGHAALRLLITEIGRSALRWAGRLLVVNGHGGNLASLAGAVAGLREEGRDVAWWPCAPPGADAHAGRAETSMMLRLRHGTVRVGRAVAGPTDPVHRLMDRLVTESVRGVSPCGVLGDPAGAGADEGEELLGRMADRLADDIRAWRISGRGRLGRPSGRQVTARTGARR
ncbi:mycofactocin biosynthesis peptidyl-dipeptidase MftE [Streptomyces sp. GC420]|uniref:mycofactocin biosynthesis peptidyl-dipeptidase MftE n=1 Tax=Streptomyces sp. GC420 TaxID=2697568 RepID=UPI0014151934|nr:mycofactocin biosynthesis peptidyl-dipeptidase MftE [Streptomyces sp. GC420]NBM17427.1 mycofactocin biosynthesis peptidyl-dipeptidase MftE [Streptomyces sp. GC420]